MNRSFGHNVRWSFGWPLVPLLLLISPAGSAIGAELQEAQVTRIIQDVRLLPSQAVPRAAVVNDTVRSDTAVRTGDESRTELTFTDQTLARLGANSIFTFNEGTRTLDLGTGVMLLHVPKGAGGTKISTAAVTAAITGTTVLIEAHSGKSVAQGESATQDGEAAPVQFGLVNKTKPAKPKAQKGYVKFISLEGTARVFLNGHPEESVLVHPGQMLILAPGAAHLPDLVEVDLEKLVGSCLLITDFPPLASEGLIAAEIEKQKAAQGWSPVVTDPTSSDIIDQALAAFSPPGVPVPIGTTVVYLGLPAGNWSSPASWDPAIVPNNGGGNTYTAVINGGTLTQDIAPGVTIQQLQMTGGTLVLTNPLTLNTGLQFTGGTFIGGNLFIAGASTQSSPMTVQNVTLNNTGTYDITFQSGSAFSGGGSNFVNSGTLRKTTGIDVITFNMPINNSGTISVLNGAFSFTAGGTNSGILSAAAGTGLNFASDFSMLNGTRFAGPGFVTFSDGTVTTMLGTITNLGTISFNSAGALTDLLLNGNVTLTGGGVVNLSGADRILGNGIFTSNNTIQGETSGAGGGLGQDQIGIVIQAGGVIDANVSGLALTIDPGSAAGLTNQGTLQASNGGILRLSGNGGGGFLNTGGLINADSGSTVQLTDGVVITGGTLAIADTGTMENLNTASLNSLTISGFFTANDSSQTTLSGTIVNTVAIVVASTVNPTDLLLNGNVTLTGGGRVSLANAARVLGTGVLTNVNNTISGDTSTGGSLGANQIGLINQAGGLIDASSGLLNVDPDPINGLINQGTMRASNGGILVLDGNGGGGFNNIGTIEAITGGSLQFSGAVTSSGVIDVGNNSLNVTGSLTQTAGTLRLNGGTVTSASALDFQGGLVDARGTINSAINNNATLRPALGGSGLTVNGNVGLMGASNLSFQIGGLAQGSQHGFLNVNGTISLSGNLVVSFANGFQNSISGSDMFTILSATTVSNTFGNVLFGDRLTTSDGFGSFLVTLSGNTVVLSNFLATTTTTVATWTDGTGNWSDPTNWDSNPRFPNNGQPGPGDLYDAILANGGTITVDIPITIQNFTLTNGTVMSTQTLTINQLFNWGGGTLGGGGVIDANGGILFSNGNAFINGGTTLNNAVGQTATLNNAGAALVLGPSIFNNNGTFLAQNDRGVFHSAGIATFNNAGTFTRDTSAGTFVIGQNIIFNNTGTVNVNSGTLQINGNDGGSTSGDFNIASGATLIFNSDFNFAAASDLAGAGTINFNGGTQTISGTYTLPNLDINGATVISNIPLNVSAFNLFNGTFSSALSLNVSGLFTWNAGTLTGGSVTNANGGILFGNGGVTLDGSTLNNATGQTATQGAGVTLVLQNSAIFNNNGTFLAQGDNVIGGAGSTFNNIGTFTRDTSAGEFLIGGGVIFNNTGTVNVQTGILQFDGNDTGTTTGAFNISAGATLALTGSFNGGPTSNFSGAGAIDVIGTGVLVVNGSYSVPNLTIQGDGANFPMVTFNVPVNLSTVTMLGANEPFLINNSILNISGLFTWTFNLEGTGVTNANGGILLNDGSTFLVGTTLNNAAGQTATMNGTAQFGFINGSVFNNNGTFLAQNDSSIFFFGGAVGTFNNNGTFTRDTSAGTFLVTGVPFVNSGTVNALTGTLEFDGAGAYTQTAGTLNVVSTVTANAPLDIQGGLVTGTGTINAAINNNGTIRPALGGGGLTVNGNVSLLAASNLSFQIGGLAQGSQYGFLNVNGTVGLGGNLVVSFANNFQNTITNGNTFTIATASGGVTGIFANIASGARLTTSDGFGSFLVTYGGNTIALSQFLAGPVASDAVWTGGASNWNDATHWTTNPNFPNNGQPGAGDLYNATLNSGTITLNIPVTIQELTVTAGTITGANILTANQLFTWSGGSLEGGIIVNANGGTLINGGNVFLNNATLNNPVGQTATDTGFHDFNLSNTSVINNAGTWLAQADLGIDAGASSTFNNTGTFTRNTSGTIYSIANGVAFNNTGIVNVDTGTLALLGGGTSTGAFHANAGALLFNGGTTDLNGATFDGAGTVQVAGGVWNLNAGSSYNVTGTTVVSGGTANFNVSATTNVLNATGGTLSLAAGRTFTISGLFDWDGGFLAGGGVFNANAGITMPGGTQMGLNNVTLNNAAGQTATDSGFHDFGLTNSTINNAGTWLAQSDLGIDSGSGSNFNNTGTFTRNTSAAIYFILSGIAFNNSGIVNVDSGTLDLLGGGTSTGTFHANAGLLIFAGGTNNLNGATVDGAGMFEIGGGVWNLNAGSSYNITGTTIVGGGTANFNVSATTNLLNVSLGTLALASGKTFTINGLFDWSGGFLAGGGVFNANAGITMAGGTQMGMNNATLNNPAGQTATDSGFHDFELTTSTINNAGTWLAQSDLGLDSGSSSTFNNTGTFTRNTSASNYIIAPGIAFNNSGTVNAQTGFLSFNGGYTQTAGTLNVTGSVFSSSALAINGGTVTGTGTIQANINNAGTILPAFGSGGLKVTGNVSLLAASNLSFQIGGLAQGTQYGFLNVTGTAALGGNLVVSFANSFQNTITNGDTFTIATASGGITGIFANIASGARLDTSDGFGSFQVTYGGNTIVLSNFLPPGPVIDAIWTDGSGNWSNPANWSSNPNFPNDGQPSPGDLYNATLANGGTITLDIPISIQNFTLSNGTVTGANSLTINQLFTWSGGILSGGVIANANGGILFNGAEVTLNVSSLINAAGQTATISGAASLALSGGGTVFNNGTFQVQNDQLISGTGTFNNVGTFTRDTSPGTFVVGGGVVLNNSGTVSVLSGTLRLDGGGTSSGTFAASAGALLELASGFSFTNGAAFSGAGTVRIDNGTASTFAGTINNAGNIQVNSLGNFTDFLLNGDVTLTGGGTLNLVNAARVRGSGILTNVDNTIQGETSNLGGLGYDQISIVNGTNGLIDANVSGKALNVDPNSANGLTNRGIMQASNGGILLLDGNNGGGFTNNNNGTITALVGSQVQLTNGAVVIGGTLTTVGTGAIHNINVAELFSLTNAGSFIGNNGTSTSLTGNIINTGTILLDSTGNLTDLFVNGNVTLTGAGTIQLVNADRVRGNGAVLTNASTIEGETSNSGSLGTDEIGIVNQASGLIDANVSGLALNVDPKAANGLTNDGIMRASNGGILLLNGFNGGTFTNNNTISALNGSEVQLTNGVNVIGGTFSTAGTGVIRNITTALLSSVTNAGSFIGNNGTSTSLTGNIINTGTILLDSTGNLTDLFVNGNVTLTGAGTLQLVNADRVRGNGAVLTNASTIEGETSNTGSLGTDEIGIVNQASGLIDANVSGLGLNVDPNAANGLTNDGIMRASNGGILLLNGFNTGTFTNNNTISALNGSEVQLTNGANVIGGTFSTAGTGVIRNITTALLTSVTNAGSFIGNNATTTNIAGTITNTGSISLNSAGNFTDLVLNGDVTLTGGGTLNLVNADRVRGTGILTNVNNVIQGETNNSGSLGTDEIGIVNQASGLIDANVSGLALNVDPNAANGLTNDGIMRASNGGILLLNGFNTGTFTNNNTISALNGSEVQLTNGANVIGGTFSTAGTGVIRNITTALLTSVTNAGSFIGNNATTTNIAGTITNTGSISLNSAGNFTDLVLNGDVTLTGGGTLNLVNADRVRGTGILTNVNNVIQGETNNSGSLGTDEIGIVNQASGLIDANVSGLGLNVDPNAANGLTNNGIMRASNGGILLLNGFNGGSFSNSGTVEAISGGVLQFSGAVTSSGVVDVGNSSLGISGGGTYTQTAGTFRLMGGSVTSTTTLDFQGGLVDARGSISGSLNNNGTLRPALGAATGLNVNGNVTLLGASNLSFQIGGLAQGTQYGFLNVTGAAALGGNLVVSFANSFQNTITNGNTFTIAAASGGLTGIFANIASGARLDTNDGFGSFVVTYGGNTIVLSNFLLPPSTTSAIWTGGAGNWSSAANWSSNPNFPNNGQPGAADLYNATLANGGAINRDIAITIENFTLTSGTVFGPNSLTINQLLTWSSGVLSGSGAYNANGGILFDNGIVALNGSTLNSAVGQVATMSGAGASITFSNGAVFNNNGTFLAQNDHGFAFGGGGDGIFNNVGTFTRDTSAGAFTIAANVVFNNTGTVNVNSGTLLLNGTDGGSTTGDFSVASGATLEFASAFNFAASSAITGAGTVLFSNGISDLNGSAYDIANFVTTLNGFVNITGTTSLMSLSLSGGGVTGPGTLNVAGLLSWTDGSMNDSGITNANGGLFIDTTGFALPLVGRTLNNAAGQTATWTATSGSSGSILLGFGAVFNNNGTFFAQTDHDISDFGGGGGTFNNNGIFTRNNNAGTLTIGSNIAFNNSGTVNAQTGTLAFNSVYTQTAGTLNVLSIVSSSSALAIQGGLVTGTGTINAAINNNGTIRPALGGGGLTVNGNVSLLAASNLSFQIGGLAQGSQYGFLNITGTAALGGNLVVSFANSFQNTITNGDTFTIATASGGVTGIFANIASGARLDTSDGFGSFQVNYGGNTIALSNFLIATSTTSAVWIDGSGNWSVPANWSSNPNFPNNGQPGAGDLYDATLSNGGIISVNVPITIEHFTLTNGTVTGANNLTINQLFTWSGGTITGSGAINANGGITLSGNSGLSLFGRSLNNAAGQTAILGGTVTSLNFGNGALFNNNGTFLAQSDGGFGILAGSGNAFNNPGTFTRNTGTGTFTVGGNIAFNNTGVVNVQTGTLVFNGGASGATTGDFNIDSGAILRFDSSFDLGASADLAGAGTIEFKSGTINVGGTYNITGATTFTGATVNFNAPITSLGSGPLDLSNGTINFNSNAITVPALNLTGGTLGGTADLTSTGLLTWSLGTVTGSGAINANGGITLSGNSGLSLFGRSLNNAAGQTATLGGTVTSLNFGNGALFNNNGTFLAQSNGGFGNLGGSGNAFNNLGTFTRNTGAGTFTIGSGVAFDNSGTVNVNSGTLSLNSTTTSSGPINVSGGATLSLGGMFTQTAGAITLSSGNLAIGGNTMASSINGTSGMINVAPAGSLTVANGFDFRGIDNLGTPGGTLTLTAPSVTLAPGAINGARFSGGNAAAGQPGGNGGTLTVTATTGDIVIGTIIDASTGLNGVGVPTGGTGGTVGLTANQGTVTVNNRIQVSDSASGRRSAAGGNINLSSARNSGVAINVANTAQLLALLDGAAPGPGGLITINATSVTGNSQVNVAGTIQADRGGIDIRHSSDSGQITLGNSIMMADIIKVATLGDNSTLNIGGGSISAVTLLRLYAGSISASNNSTINFNASVNLTGAQIDIAAHTVNIVGAGTMVMTSSQANVYATVANYQGSGGTGGPGTGTFTGAGATTQALLLAPPLGPPGVSAVALPPAALSKHRPDSRHRSGSKHRSDSKLHSDIRESARTTTMQNRQP